ncbi:MAG: hypothetical protein IEMM0002_1200 [bacterium]|nr:MAG: hypothetical protein IEMM0002_1200 [bacterium]
MDLSDLAVFAHVICGTVLVMTVVMMQLVVGPSMAGITDARQKKSTVAGIQKRWHPVVDAAIIIQTITGLFFIITRWHVIGTTTILHFKVTFGLIALFCANLLHFYYRGLKRRLAAKGQTDRLARVNRLTGYMEKIVLVTAGITFLLGVTYNHF